MHMAYGVSCVISVFVLMKVVAWTRSNNIENWNLKSVHHTYNIEYTFVI